MTEPLTPLHDRVSAPTELPLPTHSDVTLWRPATKADTDGILKLQHVIAQTDHPNWSATREDVAEIFDLSYFDAEQDSLIGLDSDGRIVAEGTVLFPPGQETLVRSLLQGGVHPSLRGRGIGRQLLDWQLGRAKQQLASSSKRLPGWIMVDTDERAGQNVRLFERVGLTATRYFLSVERILSEPIRTFETDSDIRIEKYGPELSKAVHETYNEVFLDHWGSQPKNDESWQNFVTSETFREDLSFVAIGGADDAGADAERVVGFVLSTVNEEDWERQGFTGSYIALVGILREWRGKRIAQALLSEQLKAGKTLGYDRATLDVDSDSPTGAMGLYSGMGFVAAEREIAFTMQF